MLSNPINKTQLYQLSYFWGLLATSDTNIFIITTATMTTYVTSVTQVSCSSNVTNIISDTNVPYTTTAV